MIPFVTLIDPYSAGECTPGWLEPLLSRIHEDPTRVVIPDIRPLDIERLSLLGGHAWPPYKGSFNWRLTFTIIGADPNKDLVWPAIDKPTKQPL